MKNLEKFIGIGLLLFAVGFNLWLYRLEPTAKVDPNDNTFQFALVYRTNQIWDFADKKCMGITKPLCVTGYLVDHWVPNWNEGFNLPNYYSHIPQIVIVGSWRMFRSFIGLFQYYHLIIYLLLSLFPLSVFLALRVTGLSWMTAGFGSLLASQISTDGLYGLDPPSFLWRGYGLSSQLFAMIFVPLAIAYAWRFFQTSGDAAVKNIRRSRYILLFAIAFLVLTTAGHLGIGMMTFMSLVPLAITEPLIALIRQKWSRDMVSLLKTNSVKLVVLAGISIFLLSYWIIPALLGDKFHAFSFWDPVWKFNSYGARETIGRLFNGDLFDFGRLPVYTGLVLVGFFVSLFGIERTAFSMLLIFWFLLYFGRTTWGGLIDLIPAMKEFHLSRYIVSVHLAGLFLAPIGLNWIVSNTTIYASRFKRIPKILVKGLTALIVLVLLFPIYKQTVRYNDLNNFLIKRANTNYNTQSPDMNTLVTTLQNLPPGRVFAGRGGGWGKEFRIAETNMTMYLSNFALPTVLWLPETWSPNGDTEQYFREDKLADYDLFNMRYVATPANFPEANIQPFWKLLKENPSWKLYTVATSGYFTAGFRPGVVSSDKYNRTNVVRLWIQSDDPKNGLYPELTFDTKNFPKNVGLPNFKMLDEVTYLVPGGQTHNLWTDIPRYISPLGTVQHPDDFIRITSQSSEADMIFKAHVEVTAGCTECLVVLKQTYHPNWRILVDGKRIAPIITFPFYIGIPVAEGTHTIIASYEPSGLKIFLLVVSEIALIGGIIITWLRLR